MVCLSLAPIHQLVLRDNAIVEVPREVSKCLKLKTLHLQGNQIMALPLEIGEQIPLLTLFIRHLCNSHCYMSNRDNLGIKENV